MQRSAWMRVLPCLLLLACSAPESANHALRCAASSSCPDELVCYRGFCVDDGSDPATGGPVRGEPAVDTSDGGRVGDPSATSDASASGTEARPGTSETAADPSNGSTGSAPPAGQAPSELPPSSTSGATPSGSEPASKPTSDPANKPTESAPTTSATAPDAAVVQAPGVADASMPTPAPPVNPTPSPTPAPTPSPQPMPTPVADAGAIADACVKPCATASYNEKQCNQCVKDTFGANPDKLCGEADDDEPLLSLSLDPLCVSLCLGAARNSSPCIGLLSKKGPGNSREQP